MMNLNKGCIEIVTLPTIALGTARMNLNKGCIEIPKKDGKMNPSLEMNLNKGCIEIYCPNLHLSSLP